MSEKHIGLEIRERVLQYQQKNAIYYKDIELNRWKGISWIELGNQVQQLSKALINFGIEAKQNIGIFAENMPEWIIADISIMSIRAVTIPIYATNSKKEAEYLVNDAEISVIFVGGQNEYDKA
ncbi:MAG: AMP-binding protein, partial [Bacteroidetes bacterium]|nr:AMP-binding protein [Bacteroidota bacterium]